LPVIAQILKSISQGIRHQTPDRRIEKWKIGTVKFKIITKLTSKIYENN
jgi:hypothetical protein